MRLTAFYHSFQSRLICFEEVTFRVRLSTFCKGHFVYFLTDARHVLTPAHVASLRIGVAVKVRPVFLFVDKSQRVHLPKIQHFLLSPLNIILRPIIEYIHSGRFTLLITVAGCSFFDIRQVVTFLCRFFSRTQLRQILFSRGVDSGEEGRHTYFFVVFVREDGVDILCAGQMNPALS